MLFVVSSEVTPKVNPAERPNKSLRMPVKTFRLSSAITNCVSGVILKLPECNSKDLGCGIKTRSASVNDGFSLSAQPSKAILKKKKSVFMSFIKKNFSVLFYL